MPDNWQSVDLKHLRALRAVAEKGTFWAAAGELNASLSTVSDHVGALEALVGQRLVERSRGRRTVELTEAGRLLLGHAAAIEAGKHQDLAEDFLRARGVRPRFVFRSNDNATVQAMVAAGLGVALAPLLAVDENDPKVRLLSIAEPVPPRVLVVVWHRDRYRPPAAAAFVDTAVAVAAEVERSHAAFMARLARSARSVQLAR